jgi:hypothetical protein
MHIEMLLCQSCSAVSLGPMRVPSIMAGPLYSISSRARTVAGQWIVPRPTARCRSVTQDDGTEATAGHAKRLHVDQDGTDSDVKKGSPFWTEIRVLGADGKPTLDFPVRNGYFEIALPAAMLRDQPPTITLSWIDFYRG